MKRIPWGPYPLAFYVSVDESFGVGAYISVAVSLLHFGQPSDKAVTLGLEALVSCRSIHQG